MHTPQEIYFQGNQIQLQAEGQPAFEVGVFPALPTAPGGGLAVQQGAPDGIF